MEFLRFGSSVPGSYWGCCACCVIQNFKVDPDAPAAIELTSGDGNSPLQRNGKTLFAGPTYRDIFWSRLRIGTFSTADMPNHAFIAIMTGDQIEGKFGKAWLEILREAGFEFIRTVCNSVYAGSAVADSLPKKGGSSQNHIFGLFRNIGNGAIADPFTPPKEWQDLPSVKTEAWSMALDPGHCTQEQESVGIGKWLAERQFSEDKAVWEKIGPAKLLTEDELSGVPIHMAGIRSLPQGNVTYPQQKKEDREAAKAEWDQRLGAKPAVSLRAAAPNPCCG